MDSVIFTKLSQCQDCYKCVRQCPVKAIKISNGHAEIIDQLCIACGTCVKVCPVNAKQIRDDKENLINLLKNKKRDHFAILAPSYLGEFGNISDSTLISMLQRLGFTKVADASLGVKNLENCENENNIINSSCPVVIDYIVKYKPELVESSNKTASPVHITAKILKSIEENSTITFIAPCPAKKRECDEIGEIDLAITFQELRNLFELQGIQPTHVDINKKEKFFPYTPKEELFYPFDNYYSKDKKINISGTKHFIEQLEKLDTDNYSNIELYSCDGGCVNGPTTLQSLTIIDKYRLAKQKYSQVDNSDNSININNIKIDIDENAMFKAVSIPNIEFSEENVKDVLISLEKRKKEDELNCSGCGYDSCRDFAKAILNGHAEKSMCLSYMKKIANNKANKLIQTIPAGVVIVNSNMEILECNQQFASIAGEDSLTIYKEFNGFNGAKIDKILNISNYLERVLESSNSSFTKDLNINGKAIFATFFCLEQNSSACAVLVDISTPIFKKEEIIKRTEEVIENNLKTVQQIAYLLGENAAQTESVLNSIIDTFKPTKIERKL